MRTSWIYLNQYILIQTIKLLLIMASCVFLLIGYFLDQDWKSIGQGQEIAILMDVSQSMLVKDAPAWQARLSFAKSLINSLISKSLDTKRGLSAFAGNTQIISPMTTDTKVFLNLMEGINYKTLSQQGSDVAQAITATLNRFWTGDEQKTLIVLTDGTENTITIPEEIIKQYKNRNIQVIIGWIGSEQWWPIVLDTDAFGQEILRLYNGNPVITKLNTQSLESITHAFDGVYRHCKETSDLSSLLSIWWTSFYLRWMASFITIVFYLLIEYCFLWAKNYG